MLYSLVFLVSIISTISLFSFSPGANAGYGDNMQIIERITTQLELENPKYQRLIENIEKRKENGRDEKSEESKKSEKSEKDKKFIKETVETVETAESVIKNHKPDIKENSIDKLLNDFQNIKNNSCTENKKEGFRIFVSFSMPDSLLLKLDKTARQIGAKLVIRGLKNNSFKETFSYIKSINEKGSVIDIDPKSFEEFEITQVPSFVINQGGVYDKIVGNVSIPYVLNKFANNGELKEKAAKYLRRLKS